MQENTQKIVHTHTCIVLYILLCILLCFHTIHHTASKWSGSCVGQSHCGSLDYLYNQLEVHQLENHMFKMMALRSIMCNQCRWGTWWLRRRHFVGAFVVAVVVLGIVIFSDGGRQSVHQMRYNRLKTFAHFPFLCVIASIDASHNAFLPSSSFRSVRRFQK